MQPPVSIRDIAQELGANEHLTLGVVIGLADTPPKLGRSYAVEAKVADKVRERIKRHLKMRQAALSV